MRRVSLTLTIVLLVGLQTAHAGIFSRKDKPSPAVQVMDLLNTLKNNADADKRADAAEELRQFDGQEFPEIAPALINALQRDSDAGVRRQAAESLGRIKPTSVEAEQALQQATDQDGSTRVRWKARTALLGYRVATAAQPPKPPPAVSNAKIMGVPVPSPLPKPPATRPLPAPPVTPGPVTQKAPPVEDAGPILNPPRATPASLSRPVAAPKPPVEDEGPILNPQRP